MFLTDRMTVTPGLLRISRILFRNFEEKWDMVTQALNPSTGETEAEGSLRVQGHSGLHSETQYQIKFFQRNGYKYNLY